MQEPYSGEEEEQSVDQKSSRCNGRTLEKMEQHGTVNEFRQVCVHDACKAD